MKRSKRFAILIFAVALLLGSEVSNAGGRVAIRIGPPPPRKEVVRVRTRIHAVWVTGHWYWHPIYSRYIWIGGNWIDDRPGFVWVNPHWKQTPSGWTFIEGHWKRT